MLIDELRSKEKWEEFSKYKDGKDFICSKDKEEIKTFIENKEYLNIMDDYVFSCPKKHLISKNNTKKRIIYTFEKKEMIILKFVSFLLYRYDDLFCPNLYSFRQNTGVKRAIVNIRKIVNLPKMFGYKLDITNYFNSINSKRLLMNLEQDIDKDFFSFIKKIILGKKVMYNGEEIEEEKGVMAGIPLAPFLANYYLKDLDKFFWDEKVVYMRYSDDIVLFCNTQEEIIKYSTILKEKISDYELKINSEKEKFFNPKDKWNFLGFSFQNKTIDISDNSINKIKGKIKRSAKGIRRWMIKNNAKYEVALKAMNRKYNRKFYGKENNELSWMYWYFPFITTSKGLQIIDNYMQEELRYIVTGKHNKKNYEIVSYKKLKECNYRPLVSEFYKLCKKVNVRKCSSL